MCILWSKNNIMLNQRSFYVINWYFEISSKIIVLLKFHSDEELYISTFWHMNNSLTNIVDDLGLRRKFDD